jgi:hypothetical protein
VTRIDHNHAAATRTRNFHRDPKQDLDAAVLGFIGVIGLASDGAVAGFSNGTGVVDVTGVVVCAAEC